MDVLKTKIGFSNGSNVIPPLEEMVAKINFKLKLADLPTYEKELSQDEIKNGHALLGEYQDQLKLLLHSSHSPIETRLQNFIYKHFPVKEWGKKHQLPQKKIHLDSHGQARTLSLPPDKDFYKNEYVDSYRIQQGVLHNPINDRRTTKNSFHISQGGYGFIEHNKITIPQIAYGNLLWHALHPPKKLLELPFTSTQKNKAQSFVSLFLRPLVFPEVPGFSKAKSMEMLFLVPGSLVSNLDFVESIFGNAGDPLLPQNDSALDVENFTGHSGLVILAPHMTKLTKKELGLPHFSKATELQKKDGMCWKKEGELYNDGNAFKAFFRTEEGLVITLIGDNYFGYCKKEVKTQISFAANLAGLVEEEHAGGAFICPSYSLGDSFREDDYMKKLGMRWKDVSKKFKSVMHLKKEGYGVDKNFPHIIYVPDNAEFDLHSQSISWKNGKTPAKIKLLPDNVYVHPSGYKIRMEKHSGAPSWRLVGSVAEGTLCHKPCTVSGGGKSEISKSISDSIVYHNFYIKDFEADFAEVEKLLAKDYGDRFKEKITPKPKSRPILSSERSLGSVIKLMTPADEYTDSYNKWLTTIPKHILHLVLAVKRFYKPEWGKDWKQHFSVDYMDGTPGYELNLDQRKLISSYLRVGTDTKGKWQLYRLRIDYMPAEKIQMEDDITASITLPAKQLKNGNPKYDNFSQKFVQNCEYRLFQRPDDAKHRGFDIQAEHDLAQPNTFVSNYQPLDYNDALNIYEDKINFEKFTPPMKGIIENALKAPGKYFISSSEGRLINGIPSPNVRYLQTNPNLIHPEGLYLNRMSLRLHRKLSPNEEPIMPVNAVLIGRRNNPSDHAKKILPLAVYNPLHYQPLPELFMDFISSLTGKSPSTTGAGSEGPLTKGPFNMLNAITDLNNALVSYILCGYPVFSTPAGHIGSKYKVDHDLSLLIPEIWCRLDIGERDIDYLIKNRYFEKLEDFKHKGRTVLASRLGYRITQNFVRSFLGRVFVSPLSVFPEDMLKPEKQNMDDFVDGVCNITDTQMKIAEAIVKNGGDNLACPPLKVLIHIMAYGEYQGLKVDSPEFRDMFKLDNMIKSDWYSKRLQNQVDYDKMQLENSLSYLNDFKHKEYDSNLAGFLNLDGKIRYVKNQLKNLNHPNYQKSLVGTIGKDGMGI